MAKTASRKIYGTNKVNNISSTLLTPDLPRGKRPPGNLEKEKSEIMEEEEELFASVHSSSLQVVIYPQLRRPLVFPGLINGQTGKASLQQLCSENKSQYRKVSEIKATSNIPRSFWSHSCLFIVLNIEEARNSCEGWGLMIDFWSGR